MQTLQSKHCVASEALKQIGLFDEERHNMEKKIQGNNATNTTRKTMGYIYMQFDSAHLLTNTRGLQTSQFASRNFASSDNFLSSCCSCEPSHENTPRSLFTLCLSSPTVSSSLTSYSLVVALNITCTWTFLVMKYV